MKKWRERRSVDRLQMRWCNDLKKTVGLDWYNVAQYRDRWKSIKEGYIRRTKDGYKEETRRSDSQFKI